MLLGYMWTSHTTVPSVRYGIVLDRPSVRPRRLEVVQGRVKMGSYSMLLLESDNNPKRVEVLLQAGCNLGSSTLQA